MLGNVTLLLVIVPEKETVARCFPLCTFDQLKERRDFVSGVYL